MSFQLSSKPKPEGVEWEHFRWYHKFLIQRFFCWPDKCAWCIHSSHAHWFPLHPSALKVGREISSAWPPSAISKDIQVKAALSLKPLVISLFPALYVHNIFPYSSEMFVAQIWNWTLNPWEWNMLQPKKCRSCRLRPWMLKLLSGYNFTESGWGSQILIT